MVDKNKKKAFILTIIPKKKKNRAQTRHIFSVSQTKLKTNYCNMLFRIYYIALKIYDQEANLSYTVFI